MNRNRIDNTLNQASISILEKAKGRRLLFWSGSDKRNNISYSLVGLHFQGFDCILRIQEPPVATTDTQDIFPMDVLENDSRLLPSPEGEEILPDGSRKPCVWHDFPVGKTVLDVLVFSDDKTDGDWDVDGRDTAIDDACGIALVFDDGCILFEKTWIGTDFWTISFQTQVPPTLHDREPANIRTRRL